MPNYTFNILTLTGPIVDLGHFLESNQTKENPTDCCVLSFNKCVPLNGDENLEDVITKWGTKWDAIDTEVNVLNVDNRIEYKFQTAWSPPRAWLIAVSTRYLTIRFINYAEDDCLNFLCKYQYFDGVESELFNYNDHTLIDYIRIEKKIQAIDIYNYLMEMKYDMNHIVERYVKSNLTDDQITETIECDMDDEMILKHLLDEYSDDKELLVSRTATNTLLEYMVDWLKKNSA